VYEESGSYTEVFCWGSNRYGQLGLGNKQTKDCYSIPRFCTFNVVIRAVSCGNEHSAFITDKGQIFSFGNNIDGRLGLGEDSPSQSNIPCLVDLLSSKFAVEISCGGYHTMAVMENGEVFSWGLGEYGALGIGSSKSQWLPTRVVFPEPAPRIVKVSCGARHSAMIDGAGRLFVVGANESGQLGIGLKLQEMFPTLVTSINEDIKNVSCSVYHTLILTMSGRVYVTGGKTVGELGAGNNRNLRIPIEVQKLRRYKIIQIAAGHFLAVLTNKGEVFIWGTNDYFEPTPLTSITANEISIGNSFSALIDYKGNLHTWGNNTDGELAQGDMNPRSTPCLVSALKGKILTRISCGGKHGIALGQTKNVNEESYGKAREEVSYNEELRNIENRIVDERDRSFELEKRLQNEQSRVYHLEADKNVLERRYRELEEEAQVLENELRAAADNRSEKHLDCILREYEEKIAKERAMRVQLEQERNREIAELKETYDNLELNIKKLQNEKFNMEDQYKRKLNEYNNILLEYEREIQLEEAEHENLIRRNSENEMEMEAIRNRINQLRVRKNDISNKVDEMKRLSEELRYQLNEKQRELELVTDKCNKIKNELGYTAKEIDNVKGTTANQLQRESAEIERLRRLLDDKSYDNSDLEGKINLKQSEIDTLQKDVEAWKKVAENVDYENSSLRQIIAELEDKNKKLSNNLIDQERKHIREGELKVINEIRNSSSPMKIHKILTEDYTSPNPLVTPDDQNSIFRESRVEPVIKSTEKLMRKLNTESPIRKKVATECLSPEQSIPKDDNYNKTNTVITAVIFNVNNRVLLRVA